MGLLTDNPMYIAAPRPMAVLLASSTSLLRTTRRFTSGFWMRSSTSAHPASRTAAARKQETVHAEDQPQFEPSLTATSRAASPVPSRTAPRVSNLVRRPRSSGPFGTMRHTTIDAVTRKTAANAKAARKPAALARMPVRG